MENGHLAEEAGQLLDELEGLLGLPEDPDAYRMLTLSAGVRQIADRAGAETVGQVAERLEDAARSILSDNIAWSDDIRELAGQTVRDLKLLVRAVNRWGEAEEKRVKEAIEKWDDMDVDREPAQDADEPAAGAQLGADDLTERADPGSDRADTAGSSTVRKDPWERAASRDDSRTWRCLE